MSEPVHKAIRTVTSPRSDKPRSVARERTDFIITLVLMVVFIRVTTVEAFRIPTGSMEDTLLVGDFLLVNKFVYGVRTPDWIGIPFTDIGFDFPSYKFPGPKSVEPGDIVVFKYPRNPKLNYIKRCIAGPGQTIEVRNRLVYVDGQLFEDPPHSKHTREMVPPGVGERGIYGAPPNAYWSRDNFGPIKVPARSYFMMGDNRDNSEDSRFWGFVPEENIVGQALVIYLSYNKYVDFSHWYDIIRWGRIGDMIH